VSQTFNFGARHSSRITTDAPLVLDPSNHNVVYFGGNVLDRSTDRAAPFTQISPPDPDFLTGPVPPGRFDAVYSLDVFEHIPAEREDQFIENVARSLTPNGAAIIGSPSLQSQAYASEGSKAGHVNCKDGRDYRRAMEHHFANVFLFSMNDEVVHTGFAPMAHYLLALCAGPRS